MPTIHLAQPTFSTPLSRVSHNSTHCRAGVKFDTLSCSSSLCSYFTIYGWITIQCSVLGTGGGRVVGGYQKTSSQHTYGAGALNISAQTEVPKVKENLGYSKSEGAGTSQYGAGAMGVETAKAAPKLKHEGLGQIDKTREQVHQN